MAHLDQYSIKTILMFKKQTIKNLNHFYILKKLSEEVFKLK